MKTRKLVSLLTAAAMILSLSACAGQPAAAPAASSDAPAAAAEAPADEASAPAEAVEGIVFGDYGEVVSVPPYEGESSDLTMFVNHTWWTPTEWKGLIPEYISKQTGVNLTTTIAADGEQLPLMISSGELPDLIYTDNAGNLITILSDPDLCWPLEDLMAEYYPGFVFEEGRAEVNRVSDGKFYTVRNNYSSPAELAKYDKAVVGVNKPTVRKSIYEALGSPEIKTTEDFYNLLMEVKEKYPDLIPAMFNTNWTGAGQSSCMFLTDFGCTYANFGYNENDDTVSYYITQDGRLDYYKYMNRLYRDGLMLAENYAFNNEDESYNYAYNLQCFAYIKGSNANELNQKCASMGVEEDWIDLPVALNYGTTFKRYDDNIGWSGLFVSKSCKDPAAAARLLAYLFYTEGMRAAFWGIEGEHWHWSEDGTYPLFIDDYYDSEWRQTTGIKQWGLLSGTWAAERLANFNANDPGVEDNIRLSDEAKASTIPCPAVGLVMPEADSDEQIIKSKLDTMVKAEEMKIYLAESEEACEQAYNDMIELARSQGMDELDAWANEAYQAAKEKMGQ